MKRHTLPKNIFSTARNNFLNEMQDGSVAVFFANDEMSANADATYKYQPSSDLFYLSGIEQEGTRLVLFKNNPFAESDTYLYIKKTSDLIATWEGYKYTKEHAAQVSGIPLKDIFWDEEFEAHLQKYMINAKSVYLNLNEHERSVIHNEYGDLRMARKLRHDYPLHTFFRAAPILKKLRSLKMEDEIAAIQDSCNITMDAFLRVCKVLKPGMMEYQVEAEIIHEFVKQNAQGHAYEPIIASGASACVLHYIDNDQECKDGDLILMDFGCRKNNYCADLTRTIPVNGKFTDRQKDVYNAVLDAYNYAKEILRPGKTLAEMREAVGLFIQDKLVALGLLTSEEVKQNPKAYTKYFMHGVSHHLGLDVHDFGEMHAPIKAGMCFTIEPGIYIREEGIGIRIETNVIVRDGAPLDLMEALPVTVAEIEAAMSRG